MLITLNNRLDEAPEQFNVRLIKRYIEAECGSTVSMDGGEVQVTETPAEIDALIAQAQRERDRMTIAARLMANVIFEGFKDEDFQAVAETSIRAADALLAALDAREGE